MGETRYLHLGVGFDGARSRLDHLPDRFSRHRLCQRFGVRPTHHQGRFERLLDGQNIPVLVRSEYDWLGCWCGTVPSDHTPRGGVGRRGRSRHVVVANSFTALVILFIDVAWRLRLLHGGADAKALMWVTLMFPTWASVPLPFSSMGEGAVVALPVSIALLIWGGLAFLFIPVVMLAVNLKRGDVRGFGDLRLAWHASMMAVDEVPHRHVWVLSDTMVMPSGEERAVHATRAPRKTPTKEALAEHLQRLSSLGVERVWVSHKMPLLVFLFPAVLPLVLFGDPTTLLMQWIG